MRAVNKYLMTAFLCFISLQAHAFGDFFTTALQRHALDAMRERGGIETPAAKPQTKVLKVNGFYFKSHDKREKGVVWVNGQQVNPDDAINGILVKKLSEKEQTLNMAIDGNERLLPFKAGQKMYLDDHKVVDAYQ